MKSNNCLMTFSNAQEAFENLYPKVNEGSEVNGTRMIRNVGFYIMNPLENHIKTPWRKWSLKYADREWDWYLSENRSVEELKKYAPIWDRMHSGDNIVNSNYGYQWNRNNQLKATIDQLKKDPHSRQAWVSLFDGKEKSLYTHDTICTLNLGFFIEDGRLCMDVLMRSNDLWFGFGNDQYCFSKVQEIVANELGVPVGWYYHFAADLHLYEGQWDKNKFSFQS